MTACYLMLMLMIGPVGSGEPITYEHPKISGDCLVRSGTFSIYVSPLSGELVIVREFDMFRVELPKRAGSYTLRYIFGRDTAEVFPGGTYPVKRGPKGFY